MTKEMKDLYTSFKKYIMYADSLREFCDKYHNYAYSESDYESHKEDLKKYGYTIIPCHDSITGHIVSYYGKI